MKRPAIVLFTLVLYFQAYSQTTLYDYSCGNQKSLLTWEESRKDSLIYLKTVQENEVQQYVMTGDYRTISWEYIDRAENTDIKVVLEDGVYKIEGTFKAKSYSNTYTSRGLPWYQNIGFHIGHSIQGKTNLKFECIRPDNLKFYEMQVDAREVATAAGIQEQRIHVHLTGIFSRFFGCDYYISLSTGQFIRYKGVHGPPGTPETIITIKK